MIDKTKGEKLPENPTIGDRYVTIEENSEYGYLYNFNAVNIINSRLQSEGKGWRIPTKADWDRLLNSIEPCTARNHDSAACHMELGKYAGKYLKSACGWLGQEDCECESTLPTNTRPNACPTSGDDITTDDLFSDDPTCGCGCSGCTCGSGSTPTPTPSPISPAGTDAFGMAILGSGYGDGRGFIGYFKETSLMWTTSHVCDDPNQDIYVKSFNWDKGGVIQEAICPSAMNSIRLVKDYDGSNYQAGETIDGRDYQAILFPLAEQIWTSSNFDSDNENNGYLVEGVNYVKANNGVVPFQRKRVIFINEWNGVAWDKKHLVEGDSIVINQPQGCDSQDYNVEYRVYSNGVCSQELVDIDEVLVNRVVEDTKEIIENLKEEIQEEVDAIKDSIDAIDEKFDNLSGAVDTVDAKVEQEILDRIAADNQERRERIASDEALHQEILDEAAARQEVDDQLWCAIHKEAAAREEVDNQIWEALNNEINGRLDVDRQMWEAINNETNARLSVEAQLWDAINAEFSARTDVDNQIWAALNEEINGRLDVDRQMWEAINNEIARAIARENEIEGQLIDNTKEYVMKVTEGVTLYSKAEGANDVFIQFDGNYGTF